MEGEHFSLCWNNFHANLSTGFHSLLKEEDLVDVTIAAEGKFLKAHKAVLSVCSPFFKELFRVNPCKHPIVILPDVNYDALCSLMQFMYQGEVSVAQEDISTFMRVAQMLKVKGLTDNNSSPSEAANGFSNSSRDCSYPDQKQNIMRRPRPAKKMIRPIQHLRPIESPKLVRSPQPSQSQIPPKPPTPQPPPAKKLCMEDDSSNVVSTSYQAKSDSEDRAVKPKAEPADPHDEENTSHSGEEPNMDLSNMLDTTLGEPSPSHPFPNWPPDFPPVASQGDTSSPAPNMVLMKSGRGQLVLLHNGHIYTLCDKKDIRSLWVCVKKKTLNCPGWITTLSGPLLLSYNGHNHPELNDVIQKLQVPNCSISPELRL